jgi:two-component system alkaline phosphatase synthesis response regulator PhoP
MKKILYIEDNLDIANSVKFILNGSGYLVDIALTGEKGLIMLKESCFDLIIFDIMLPDMSGIEVFEKARAHHEENKHSCKYIFLSILNLQIKEKEELSKKGVLDYISKPFEKIDLIKRIDRLFM